MNLKTALIAAIGFLPQETLAQEAESPSPSPTLEFLCVNGDSDNGFYAEMRSDYQLMDESYDLTPTGDLISDFAQVTDTHRFITTLTGAQLGLYKNLQFEENLQERSAMPEPLLGGWSVILEQENIEITKAINALENSMELGFAEPPCNAIS